jgi:hypothetical protein
MEQPTDWRAVCEKSARTVRRGEQGNPIPCSYLYQKFAGIPVIRGQKISPVSGFGFQVFPSLCVPASLREDLGEFGDHCGGHPKTVGWTKTGGSVFFEKIQGRITQRGGAETGDLKPESGNRKAGRRIRA